jgi:predicted DNA-binding protein (MmcQ/YjbR family)
MVMNIEELRAYCLSLPGAVEGFPFGPETLVFKVKSKIFLLSGLDNTPIRFNVKCDPEKAIELREQYDCVFPGYHMNKKYWNTVVIDGRLSNRQLQEFINDSFELVNKKK